jgi:NADH:ubiquinone oxidoreductase subunit
MKWPVIFTWWHGPGIGTRLATRFTGREVGRDAEGNVYYTSSKGRRWVIYNGEPEASRIPPEWYLWLHKSVDTLPSELPLRPRVWEKPWVPNQTGTAGAHAPSGSLAVTGKRARATGDYEAWSPE